MLCQDHKQPLVDEFACAVCSAWADHALAEHLAEEERNHECYEPDCGCQSGRWERLPTWRARYEAYLASDEWNARRLDTLKQAGYRCQKCGTSALLDVHHVTYKRLGREEEADLQALCRPCHDAADVARRHATRRRRVSGLMRKRYGDDWEDIVDSRDADEEFDDFVN